MESKIGIECKDGVYVVYLNHVYRKEELEDISKHYQELITRGIESKCIVVDARVNRIEYIPPIK
ncbi:MAG: hypothetical protein ACOZCL_08515 [Bacillota bacterium]